MNPKHDLARNERFNELPNIHVAVAGCGMTGSFMAVSLARLGVKRFTLIDSDIVDFSNLGNQQYLEDQDGMPKVTALEELLYSINGDCEITKYNTLMVPRDSKRMLRDVDIVIDGFDNPDARRCTVGYPTLHIGIGANTVMAGSDDRFQITDPPTEVDEEGVPCVAPYGYGAAMLIYGLCLDSLVFKVLDGESFLRGFYFDSGRVSVIN